MNSIRLSAVLLRQMARLLEHVAGNLDNASQGQPETHTPSISGGQAALMLQAANDYRVRRRRERFLPPELLKEPAWDMLLDLFVHAPGDGVRTTSLCIASGVPTSTALRYIDALATHGLIERVFDPDDRRAVLLRLTGQGRSAMTALYADVHGGTTPPLDALLTDPTHPLIAVST